MKRDFAEMLRRLQADGGPEALVQRTLAAHGLSAGGAQPRGPLPAGLGARMRGPADDLGMARHRTVTRHGARDWLLHRPAEPAARPALVVMLHGCTQTPADFARGTGMNEAAAAEGWHTLWPEQPGEANAMRCWNWFEPAHQAAGAGEPEILAAVVAHALHGIGAPDADVFVAGLSAGGAMAAVLAETHPGLMLAAGVHSGLPTGAAASMPEAMAAMRGGGAAPGRPSGVPMIVFHGSADPTVAASNGDALAHHIRGTTRQGRTRGREWRMRKGPAGEYWVVEGLAHAWSGGRADGSHTDPAGPDATAEMVRFFAEQRR